MKRRQQAPTDPWQLIANATGGPGMETTLGMHAIIGTNANDYIHPAGDGNNAPPGYQDVPYMGDRKLVIYGYNGDDVIFGGTKKQITLNGGLGQDTLIGQSKSDTFEYDSLAESLAGDTHRDKIVNFGITDRVRFAGALSSQTFHFGGNAFSGSANEIIQYASGTSTILAIDSNGDRIADFEIAFAGTPTLLSSELLIRATTSVVGSNQSDVIHSTDVQVTVPPGYNEIAYIAPTLYSTEGAVLDGGGGDDIIYGTGIYYSQGNLILGHGGNDVIYAADGSDRIIGGAGADRIFAGGGDDTIEIDKPAEINGLAETIDGGTGNDHVLITTAGTYDLFAASLTAVETIQLSQASLLLINPSSISGLLNIVSSVTGSTVELVTPGSLTLSQPGALTILGSGGQDTLVVSTATGTMIDGGAGADHIHVDSASGAVLSGGIDNDMITVSSYSQVTVNGDDGGDTLTVVNGSSGTSVLDGGSGNDQLTGGSGADMLIGGLGQDVLTGGGGRDRFVIDQLDGFTDSITDFSSAAGDRLDLSRLDGDTTTPSIQGFHFGGSSFTGSAGELIQYSISMTDFILAGDVNADGVADFQVALTGTFLTAGDMIDTIYGTNGNDAIVGGQANDIMNGLNGVDVLTGGQGQDVVTGGLGADTFVFRTTAGTAPGQYSRDTITDFSHAESDRIDLSNIDADTTTTGNQAFHLAGSAFTATPGELIQSTSGGHTILSGDVNGDAIADFQIDLSNGVTLVSTDFVL